MAVSIPADARIKTKRSSSLALAGRRFLPANGQWRPRSILLRC